MTKQTNTNDSTRNFKVGGVVGQYIETSSTALEELRKTHSLVLALWEELSSYRYVIEKVWDNHLSD